MSTAYNTCIARGCIGSFDHSKTYTIWDESDLNRYSLVSGINFPDFPLRAEFDGLAEAEMPVHVFFFLSFLILKTRVSSLVLKRFSFVELRYRTRTICSRARARARWHDITRNLTDHRSAKQSSFIYLRLRLYCDSGFARR